MLILRDMIAGHRYLAGDSLGYDNVICLGVPTKEEIIEKFGSEMPAGTFMKVQIEGQEYVDIWFEAPSYQGMIYIEPR